uniref:Uncharacterized protein n=1 Tax=Arundo donax TaxID=35708 RepID=A0A0A9C9W7_ARUDO
MAMVMLLSLQDIPVNVRVGERWRRYRGEGDGLPDASGRRHRYLAAAGRLDALQLQDRCRQRLVEHQPLEHRHASSLDTANLRWQQDCPAVAATPAAAPRALA